MKKKYIKEIPLKESLEEKVRQARVLHMEGLSLKEIAKIVERSCGWVWQAIHSYDPRKGKGIEFKRRFR